jgi:nucleotide-binding universal stress UspA family protein
MINGIKTILFTSDLSATSRVAYNHAAVLAAQLKAKVILLHVIERLPENYENRMLGLFGESKWHQVLLDHKEEARHAMLGKVSPRQMVRTALSEFCRESDIGKDQNDIPDNEIVVKEGDVVEEILQQAAEYSCDLIIMGASKGLLSGSAVGHNIKSVLKQSKIATLVVPSGEE